MPSKNKSSQFSSLTANSFIDLFAGCGGLSLGLMSAEWQGILAVEKDKFAFATLKQNLIEGQQGLQYEWPDWLPKQHRSIGTITKNYRNEISKLRGKVTLIAGGPPCQGYSVAGRRDKNDSRNTLFHHYIDVVKLVRPAFLLLENVRGIEMEFDQEQEPRQNKIGRPPKPFSRRIADKIVELGYHVYSGILKASDFGVAQSRQRYFLIAVHKSLLDSKDDLDPFAIIESKRLDFLRSRNLSAHKHVNVGQAISDLVSANKRTIDCVDAPRSIQIQYGGPRTNYQRLLHGGMNGSAPNSLRLPNHGQATKTRFMEILETCTHGERLTEEDKERIGVGRRCIVPLDGRRLAPTITSFPDDILHYAEPRILTVRENARLQSFPDWYEFKGNYTSGGDRRARECPRYTQVANAVPPFLAEAIGIALQSIREQLAQRNAPVYLTKKASAR